MGLIWGVLIFGGLAVLGTLSQKRKRYGWVSPFPGGPRRELSEDEITELIIGRRAWVQAGCLCFFIADNFKYPVNWLLASVFGLGTFVGSILIQQKLAGKVAAKTEEDDK